MAAAPSSAVDLEGDEDVNAIVPLPDSPSKRPKTTQVVPAVASVDPNQLLTLIQSTIQESVASSLGSVHSAVQALVEKTDAQGSRLDMVERAVGTLEELDARRSGRLDSMHDELIQLQKTLASPKAVQSPAGTPGPGSAEDITFDLVIGGWREGSTRAWVESELAKLISFLDLNSAVTQIKTFGKRPGFAKFELAFDSSWTVPRRREHQLMILSKLREANWQPDEGRIWITTDKSPKQRRVSKAMAVLNGFLHEQLGVDRGVLEIASWGSAKAFVETFRVTGLSQDHELGAKPSCGVSDLRWLVRDSRLGVNVWLDLDALAKGLNRPKHEVANKWREHFGNGTL